MNLPRPTRCRTGVTPGAFLMLFLTTFLSLHADTRGADELFFEANVHVAGEAYAEAVPLYLAAISQRPSANLHYNLGNAYFHLGDWGRARIHWERTLAMEPRHTFARRHLQMLLQELNLPEDSPGFWMRATTSISYNQWIWTAAFSAWVVLFSLLAWRWKRNSWFGLPAGLGFAALLLATFSLLLLNPTRHYAVVLDEHATLRIAPAPGSPATATPLRPAQRIRLAERYGDFFRIVLENGQEGFLHSDQFERIR